MRILVDANEAQVAALDDLAKLEQRPRAAVIRAAIDDYLARHRRKGVQEAFGLWADGPDGLEFQEKLRSEW
ncbi:ribbon-helix-helix protein, CopG family [Brevundimonas intermedia]|uniref:Ribbon-helix-helix protein, CopG family n=1 Tax=Brevundimonas intermedia TaxID=74315 RepID=A0A4Y9RVD6_9CAUL|nr:MULTISPECIES: ribbon-helix-helix protein, CopG family [Brevundimonas]RYG79160.1 MAG: ribbon-helix-helix protein, CopG family [Alphaproteobacteria bacterium]TFW11736.1 ribbon-helix-helix protein, CopG family [Brevundimonas intermedia]VXC00360.1 CopG family transcriptional regulator [Brevundimonas sp. G8]